MKPLRLASPCLCVPAVLSGCASTHVPARHGYASEKLARPGHVIIHDFAATPADVPAESALAGKTVPHGTPQTPEQLATGRKPGAEVARELVAEIRPMGLPAVRGADGWTPQVGELVIRGYFLAIDEGSAGERVLVGFGQGAARQTAKEIGDQMRVRFKAQGWI